MGSPKFEIYIPEHGSSVAEWRKAQRAPLSELPQLTADQKEVARRFGITEEEYARNVLAGTYGRRRLRERKLMEGVGAFTSTDGGFASTSFPASIS